MEEAVGRMATAGRRNLDAMVAVVVRCVAGGGGALLGPCERWRGSLEDSIDQLEGLLFCVTNERYFHEQEETVDH